MHALIKPNICRHPFDFPLNSLNGLTKRDYKPNMSPRSLLIQKFWVKFKIFGKKAKFQGQKVPGGWQPSINRSQGESFSTVGQELLYQLTGHVTRNTHMQNENPTSSCLKVMAKVKVFQKYVKQQGQGHTVKHSTMWKVLSKGILMCNMRAISLLNFWFEIHD